MVRNETFQEDELRELFGFTTNVRFSVTFIQLLEVFK
ncbi:unnamed protein product [Gongylonema pulchrum]|uniref:Transposase n=1 Tax=Gongylonema pulchrum TaxID=637853 RepID=A0A183D2I6_9BILA|nr:unnamed protein product [Gongylonema pulchrum]